MLNPYLTNSYRYLTNIYMINLKLTPTDFLNKIKIYKYLIVNNQYLINAYIIKPKFN